jgi:V-type H+-transporting ATPase subunit G
MSKERTGLKMDGGLGPEANKTADTVRLLLQAEAEAAERIQLARKEREDRLRLAVSEAEKDIAAYRARKEASFRQMQAELAGTTEGLGQKLQEKAEQLINADRARTAERLATAVDALVQAALRCEPDP